MASAGGPPEDDRTWLRGAPDHAPFPDPVAAGSLAARFEAVATIHAGRPAVVHDDAVLSYAELEARSASIASAARAAVPGPSAVALLLDQGVWFVVAFLAALRTGGLVVPLDPAYPDTILAGLLDHAGAGVLLADASTRPLATRVAGPRPVIDIDDPRPATAVPAPALGPETPATLFYTSGTTGRPKGVVDSHANVLDNVRRYVDTLRIGPTDRLSLVHGPMFSGLVSSLGSALLTGASVIPVDVRRDGLERLADLLARHDATMLHLVPSVYRRLLGTARSWPAVRVVRLEGDAATWGDVGLARDRFAPDVVVVNGLGATETGLVAQWFARPGHAGASRGTMPVGYPVPGIAVSVVDEDDRASATGSPGELVVHGRHLATGYLGDAERTASRFARDGTDPTRRTYRTGDLARIDGSGSLQVLGRRDGSHKVRGQTVDPLAVEERLRSLPGVTDAVAVTRADGGAEPRLVAYAVGDEGLDGPDLRRALAADLPGPLVPSAVVVLPALPLTSAGKLDRSALPAPGRTRPRLDVPYEAARDPLEERLAEIWAEVLDIRPVGIHDPFFDLGGDSLGAATMLLEVGRWLGRDVPPEVLARAATVAELAGQLRGPTIDGASEAVVLSRGPGPTVFLIHAVGGQPLFFRSVARAFGDDATVISIQPPDLRAMTAYEPVADRAARYARHVLEAQPEGPYHLVGQCFGGLIAHELARQLQERGHAVGTVTLLGVGPLEFPTLVSPAARRRFGRARWRARLGLLRGSDRGRVTRASVRAIGGQASRFVRRSVAVRAARLGALPRDPVDDAQAVMDFSTMTAVAASLHRAEPFQGPLRVVLGRDAEPSYLRAPHDLGRLATGEVTVTMLPGDDHAMLAPPGADELGKALRAWVDAFDGPAPQDAASASAQVPASNM